MADMALLLLVFFMVSTSTEPPWGIEVELPVAITASAEQDSVHITISRTGVIFLNGEAVTPEEVNDYLAMHQWEKDRVVSITADKNLSYKRISNLLAILQSHEFLNIVFMAEPKLGADN